MADLRLVRETESEIAFAFPPLSGLLFALLGGVFAWMGYGIIDVGLGKWIFTGVGLLFVFIGISALFWRHELRLDLTARRYTRRKGFWPAPALTEGGLEELEGVTLAREERHSKNHTYIVWVVRLPFRGEEPVSVAEERDEAKAYRRAESLTKRLRLPLLDRTEMPERVTPWDKLDETVAQRMAAQSKGWRFPSTVSAPPMGSRIQFDETPSRRTILLPRPGLSFLPVFLMLFGLAFAALGGLLLYLKLSGMPVKENPEGAGWVIAPLFLLIGLAIALCGVAAAAGRRLVREEGDTLALGWRVLGREWLPRKFAKREIEQIEVRVAAETTTRHSRLRIGGAVVSLGHSAQAPGQEVLVRSDHAVARLGKGLSDEERQWLCDALLAMASGA